MNFSDLVIHAQNYPLPLGDMSRAVSCETEFINCLLGKPAEVEPKITGFQKTGAFRFASGRSSPLALFLLAPTGFEANGAYSCISGSAQGSLTRAASLRSTPLVHSLWQSSTIPVIRGELDPTGITKAARCK